MAAEERGIVIPFPNRPAPVPAPSPHLGDLRFRTLLGEDAWASLPEAVRERFGKSVAGRVVIYGGEIVECRMSRAGRLLAQLVRLVGAPLPLSCDTFVPAVVTVSEDAEAGGQFWTRIYGRRRGFPQVIHSSKRFAGPTGLEEYIGRGLGIALRVEVRNEALHFISDHYFAKLGGRRIRLPNIFSPGALTVSHIDCGHGWFAFRLVLNHPWLGELISQTAMFSEHKAEEI
jgi:hypothetical protein